MSVLQGLITAGLTPDAPTLQKALADFLKSAFHYNDTGVVDTPEIVQSHPKLKAPAGHFLLAVTGVAYGVISLSSDSAFLRDLTKVLSKSVGKDEVNLIQSELKFHRHGAVINCWFSYDPYMFSVEV